MINTSKAILSSVSVFCIALFSTTTLEAQDLDLTWNANVAVVSDYRFRGVSLSDKDFAIQGGFGVSTSSGFYLSAWGSSIETFSGSETEIDLYGGYQGQLTETLSYNVGILVYTYPGSDNTHYFEGYGSVSGAIDALSWTVGTAYAFKQDNLSDKDNLYLYTSASYPLTDKLSVTGYFAREAGAFDKPNGDSKLDWNVGLSYSVTDKVSFGVSYIDTNMKSRLGDSAIVGSISVSF